MNAPPMPPIQVGKLRDYLLRSTSHRCIGYLSGYNPHAGELPKTSEEIEEELDRVGFERKVGP